MIIGHGIDIESISSITEIYLKKPRFAEKVLTAAEMERFHSLNQRKQMEYLAGRWSAKEAFSKAMGTGIGKLSFLDIEFLNDSKGAPFCSKSPFPGKVWVSISHTGDLAQASIILEENHEEEPT
ncbi:Holo-(acyl-carrier protein) synthase [Streptococcus sp. DD10]|uniref:holo-ACP synthase n=1 Tax=Streptococcus sp. DD10 TaxID=1777878 RepID=UPI00079C6EE9|nr:holo-ACP synthase [Streptococcus sp. DD10]KXT74624.1 Holo-(acyl-carrier protein) synthase [Streptococcus sp. DD10]